MNKNIRISIILPTYNVDKYIERCIESLEKQKLDGLEFIFVDDCSSDNSLNIIKDHAKVDDRFIIIKNNRNSGQGKCRNIGIENARGEFLSFIDPDDYISDIFYENLYKKAKQVDSDLIKGQRTTIDISENMHKSNLNRKIINGLNKHIPLYCLLKSEHQTILYKKSFIEKHNIKYGNSKVSQDKTFLLRLCLNKPSISFEENAEYYYCLNEQSATSDFSYERCNHELDALEEIIETAKGFNDSYILKYLQDVIKYVFNVYSNVPDEKHSHDFIYRLKTILFNLSDYKTLSNDFTELEILFKDDYFIPLKYNNTSVQTIQKWIEYISNNKSEQYLKYFSYVLSYVILINILKGNDNSQILKLFNGLDKKDRLQIYRYIPLNVVKLFYKRTKNLFDSFI